MPASPLTRAIRPRPDATSSRAPASFWRSWSRSSNSKTQSMGAARGWGISFSLVRENWHGARNRAREVAKQIARCQEENTSPFVRKTTSRKHRVISADRREGVSQFSHRLAHVDGDAERAGLLAVD